MPHTDDDERDKDDDIDDDDDDKERDNDDADDEHDNDDRLVRVEVVYLPSATEEEGPPRAHPTTDDHLKSFNGRQDYLFH